MDVIHLVFIIVFTLAGTEADCPDNFTLYSKDDTCIGMIYRTISWDSAKKGCENINGRLVQIFTRDKYNFVIAVRNRLYHGIYVWIGLYDGDLDGTYEYINGTKLELSKPGLGHWSGYRWVNSNLRKTKVCVAFNHFTKGWISRACKLLHWYLCEVPANPTPKVKKIYRTCTMEECSCDKEDWIRNDARGVSYAVNRVAKNFSTAALICEKLGGRLLIIPDKKTETFITQMDVPWDPKGVFYWLGMAQAYNGWTWSDGHTLLDGEYNNWFLDPKPGSECSVAIWDYWGKWRPEDCDNENFHVCEATDPCSGYLVLMMDGETLSNNDIVDKTDGQVSVIRCDVMGYHGALKTVSVACGTGDAIITDSDTFLEMDVLIYMTLHNKSCTCHVTFVDGITKEINIFINFQTVPSLVNQKGHKSRLYMKNGDKVIQIFHIHANPMPDMFELLKFGEPMNKTDYNVTIEPLDEPLTYTITVQIHDEFSSKLIGAYHMIVKNSVSGKLEYKFDVEEASDALDYYFYLVPLTVVTVLLLVATIIIKLWMVLSKRMRKKDEEKGHKEEREGGEEEADEKEQEHSEEKSDESESDSDEDSASTQPPPQPRYGRYQSTILD